GGGAVGGWAAGRECGRPAAHTLGVRRWMGCRFATPETEAAELDLAALDALAVAALPTRLGDPLVAGWALRRNWNIGAADARRSCFGHRRHRRLHPESHDQQHHHHE